MENIPTPHSISESEFMDVIQQLEQLFNEPDDEDDSQNYDLYERQIIHRFPEECRELFGLAEISIPVRHLLEIWIRSQPEDSDRLRRIRQEFYSGDKLEDHQWEISDYGHIPTRKRLAEIRVEREAHNISRAHNRETYGADSADFEIVLDSETSPPRSELYYLEMDHPFKSVQASNEREYERLSRERQLLDSCWEALVRQLATQTSNDELTVIEADLNAKEETYEREWETLCMQRSSLLHSIIDWESADH